ncbi:TPA: L,D-transpeptidase, partial [Proteus mirabilis]|nr:L,D-transpeptidase [Proteus mirabilis]
MAQQAIKRAITYSVVIGTLLSGHNVIASESETPPLFTSETPALVPAFTEDVATQDTLNSPSVSKQEVSTKLQSWLPRE